MPEEQLKLVNTSVDVLTAQQVIYMWMRLLNDKVFAVIQIKDCAERHPQSAAYSSFA